MARHGPLPTLHLILLRGNNVKGVLTPTPTSGLYNLFETNKFGENNTINMQVTFALILQTILKAHHSRSEMKCSI